MSLFGRLGANLSVFVDGHIHSVVEPCVVAVFEHSIGLWAKAQCVKNILHLLMFVIFTGLHTGPIGNI